MEPSETSAAVKAKSELGKMKVMWLRIAVAGTRQWENRRNSRWREGIASCCVLEIFSRSSCCYKKKRKKKSISEIINEGLP